MPSKIPEGLKCEFPISPLEAYSPEPVPEIPNDFEFVGFRLPAQHELFLMDTGHVDKGSRQWTPRKPRIIVRRKPEPTKAIIPSKFEESLAIQAATKIGLLATDQCLAPKDMDYIVGRWRAIDKAAILAADIAPTYNMPADKPKPVTRKQMQAAALKTAGRGYDANGCGVAIAYLRELGIEVEE